MTGRDEVKCFKNLLLILFCKSSHLYGVARIIFVNDFFPRTLYRGVIRVR